MLKIKIMKTIKYLSAAVLALGISTANAQEKKQEVAPVKKEAVKVEKQEVKPVAVKKEVRAVPVTREMKAAEPAKQEEAPKN